MVAAVGIVAIGAWAAWQAIRGASVLDRAIERVTAATGLMRLSWADSLRATMVAGPPEARSPTPGPEIAVGPRPARPVEPVLEARRRRAAEGAAASVRELSAPE